MSSALTGSSSQLQSQGLNSLQGQQPEFLSRLNSYNFGNNEASTGARPASGGFGSYGLKAPRTPQLYNFAPYQELSSGAGQGLVPRTYNELELGNQFYNGFKPNPGSYGVGTGRSGGYFLSPKDSQGQGDIYATGLTNYGLNERSLGFSQNYNNTDSSSQNVALSGESEIKSSDQAGGNAYNGGSYNFSDPYNSNFFKQGDFSKGLNYGGYGQYGTTSVNGKLENADRSNFNYTNKANRSVSGGGSVYSKVGDLSQGGSTDTQTKTKPTSNLGGQAAGIFAGAVGALGAANPIFLPLGAAIGLAGMLSPKQEIRVEDNATATASGLLDTDRGLKLSSPGQINTDDRQGVFANSTTTSPIFGTKAIADIYGDSQNKQSLYQSGIGSGELGSKTLQDLKSSASVTSADRLAPSLIGSNRRFADEYYPGKVSNYTETNTLGNLSAAQGLGNRVNANQNNVITSNVGAMGIGRRGSNVLDSNLTQEQSLNANVSSGADLQAASRLMTDASSSNSGRESYLRQNILANDLTSDTSNELLATLSGLGANVSAVQSAKQVLSGSQGLASLTQTMVQASRFVDNLEQSLPQSPEAASVIERLRQSPELVWLFDGSNSPKSIISALASNNTSTNNRVSANFRDPNQHLNSGAYLTDQGIYYTSAPNATENTSQQSYASVYINPLSTQGVQRYYTDPVSGKTFANVLGAVKEITPGEFVPINYRDTFNVTSDSNGGLSGAHVNATGNIFGKQYYYSPGQDATANSLAKYIQDLQGNRASFNQDTFNSYINPIMDVSKKSLSKQERDIANELISQNQQISQEKLNSYQASKNSLYSTLQGLLNNLDQYKNTQDNFVYSNGSLVERRPGELNNLTSKIGDALGQIKSTQSIIDGLDTNIDISDILPQLQNRLGSSRSLASSYDQYGNALYNGVSVNKYDPLINALRSEADFDRAYGTSKNSTAYLDLDSATGNAFGRFNDNFTFPYLENNNYTQQYRADGFQNFLNPGGSNYNSINPIVPVDYEFNTSRNGQDISGPIYGDLVLEAKGYGGSRTIPTQAGIYYGGPTKILNPVASGLGSNSTYRVLNALNGQTTGGISSVPVRKVFDPGSTPINGW